MLNYYFCELVKELIEYVEYLIWTPEYIVYISLM